MKFKKMISMGLGLGLFTQGMFAYAYSELSTDDLRKKNWNLQVSMNTVKGILKNPLNYILTLFIPQG